MRLTHLVLLVLALGGAWRWWHGRDAAVAAAAPSANGFVPVEMPQGAARNTVLILAPPNCPSAQAQRAERLARELSDRGIPVARGSGFSFEITNPTAEQKAGVDRAVAVFNEGAPAVFINGMAMSDPTVSQAIAEYRRTRASL